MTADQQALDAFTRTLRPDAPSPGVRLWDACFGDDPHLSRVTESGFVDADLAEHLSSGERLVLGFADQLDGQAGPLRDLLSCRLDERCTRLVAQALVAVLAPLAEPDPWDAA